MRGRRDFQNKRPRSDYNTHREAVTSLSAQVAIIYYIFTQSFKGLQHDLYIALKWTEIIGCLKEGNQSENQLYVFENGEQLCAIYTIWS